MIAAIRQGKDSPDDIVDVLGVSRTKSGKMPARVRNAIKSLLADGTIANHGRFQYVLTGFLGSGRAANGSGLGESVDGWLYGKAA